MPDDHDRTGSRIPVSANPTVAQDESARDRAGACRLDEREQQIRDDYEWGRQAPEVRRAHAGRVVVVYRRHIWGAGQTHAEALAAAQQAPDCPPHESLAFVVVPPGTPGAPP